MPEDIAIIPSKNADRQMDRHIHNYNIYVVDGINFIAVVKEGGDKKIFLIQKIKILQSTLKSDGAAAPY